MRTLRVPAFCFLLSACSTLAVPTSGGQGDVPPPATTSSSVANEIVRYTNQQRVNSGRTPLVASARLMEAARLHAQQMAQFSVMAHTIEYAQYPTLQSRLEAVGYQYANAAENVAWNSPSPQKAVDGWMTSSGHRANILNPSLTEMGAAMAKNSKGEPYWIQVFGTPR